jgi:CubicO group peptidase (beta-lactamase class C family)
MSQTNKVLQDLLEKTLDDRKIFGLSFTLAKGDRSFSGSAGNLAGGRPFFIASTTKLFTTAIVMQLNSEGRLSLDDKLVNYLKPEMISGLHVCKGKEYTKEISIRHLLAHTSGLADYFQGKMRGKESLENEIKLGLDQFWSFNDVLAMNRLQDALFMPGENGKAHYSDTNFQLLGKIIEEITGVSYEENCRLRIIGPLGLMNTYLFNDINDERPQYLYFKSSALKVPLAMSSFGPDGGMVSTSDDLLIFIRAFFEGKLFPAEYIPLMQVWKSIFFPMKAGLGIHLFKLPWFFNPFGAVPSFIGHSGLSGALAFYCPKSELYIAGTVNQVAHPDLSFRLMIQLERLSTKLFK